MSISELRFIKRCAEFRPRTALLDWRPKLNKFDVVYKRADGHSLCDSGLIVAYWQ
jgi:hypothetical protein